MAHILSLQSHVAYGYVGNRAAVFPLERLGHEVTVINTVQFSNHTGYGDWSGDIMSLEHITNIFSGLAKRGVLTSIDAVLTGYLGDSTLGTTLLHWLAIIREQNPKLIYCCDPVIGDVGRGIFVRPGVPEFFKTTAINHATILTPNQFELAYLTDMTINTLDDAKRACAMLHQRGVKYVLVTSLMRSDGNPNEIEMLLSTSAEAFLVATPQLAMPINPNGAGDMTAAIFLAKLLETHAPDHSLKHTMAAVYAVFLKTRALNRRELAIIQAQDSLVAPAEYFSVIKV
jgi:pyridoxine kinase